MFYEDVFKELNKAKIRYLVVGGVAVNLYGHIRTTLDLDILIALDLKNREKFFEAMKKMKFKTIKPKLAENLILGKYEAAGIKVVSFFRDEFELIDVFIQNPVDFDKAFKRKKLFKAKKLSIPVIPYDLLLKMKRDSGRDRDLIDVGSLENLRKSMKNAK